MRVIGYNPFIFIQGASHGYSFLWISEVLKNMNYLQIGWYFLYLAVVPVLPV